MLLPLALHTAPAALQNALALSDPVTVGRLQQCCSQRHTRGDASSTVRNTLRVRQFGRTPPDLGDLLIVPFTAEICTRGGCEGTLF